ncbi:MAG: potassium-transporting ATPase subunit KdpA [Methanomassiliicoccales archaeon]|nr:potassium-transporting ATPase subunit KdpA [Methanomassiliicoccales archaeon]
MTGGEGKGRTPMSERFRTMRRTLSKQARPALVLFLIMTLVTGVVYPLAVTGIAQLAFPHEANGSQIVVNGTVVGSELIGQWFSDPEYFWGRLSATDYNASTSGGTNFAANSTDLQIVVQERIDALHAADSNNTYPIPSDLVTASASGLDPDISYAAAIYQLPRVARERGMNEPYVMSLINASVTIDITGDKLVNVLELNLALNAAEDAGAGSGNETASLDLSNISSNAAFLGITPSDWLYIILFIVIIGPLAWLVGTLISNTYDDRPGRFTRAIGWIENRIYRPAQIDRKGMGWRTYLFSLLLFNGLGIIVLMLILMFQGILPLNPDGLGSLSIDQAFNTAVSYVTNTNWQSYSGETTMSYFTQMVGLTVQNFLSAATGLAVLIALIRGIRNRSVKDLGNFWVDMTRATLLLLPIAFIIALILVSQGTAQTLDGAMVANLIQPFTNSTGDLISTQAIAIGPVASQEAIKLLGTNGGGFFNANSAHPFENPSLLTNLIETLVVLLIPVGLCFTFGRMIKDKRQGYALLIVMSILFIAFSCAIVWAENSGNPAISNMTGVSQFSTIYQSGGNLEGKELRFGVVPSCLFTISTTATSCGAVDSMLDSYTAIGGMCPLLLMQFGEVVFGGIGSGMYGMLIFVLVAVFIAGLMIGRMPEYLGKKIGPYEMKLCTVILLLPIATVLIGTAIAVTIPEGRVAVLNAGPHGFTEILYAFTSATNNNGSAFAGLAADSPFYNLALAIAMLIGRFGIIALTLALAGSLSEKKVVPETSGTLPTHTLTFMIWLLGVVILFGALSYFLTLVLGPIAEALM